MAEPASDPEAIARQVVQAAYDVHAVLGPGLLVSVYEPCLIHELGLRGLGVERQVNVAVVYKDIRLDAGLIMDLLVEDRVIVEVKAVEKLLPAHQSRLLTCLKLSGRRLGLLINFNAPLLKNGIHRLVRPG